MKNIKTILLIGIISLVFFKPLISMAAMTVTTCGTHSTSSGNMSALPASCSGGTTNNITDISATLKGVASPDLTLNPKLPTTVYFRYSDTLISPVFCNEIYGNDMVSTQDIILNPNNNTQSFFQSISDLQPLTTYHYCAIVSNKSKIVYGQVESFTTSPCSTCDHTTVTTKAATNTDTTSTNLKGSYTSTEAVTTYFEYKKDTSVVHVSPSSFTLSNASLGLSPTLFLSPFSVLLSPTLSSTFSQTPVSLSTSLPQTPSSTFSQTPISLSTSLPQTSLALWTRVGNHNYAANTFGDISVPLTGLTPNTKYNFLFEAETAKGQVFTGQTLSFTTNSTGGGTGLTDTTEEQTYPSNGGGVYTNQNPTTTPTLGTVATPPGDATVHYHEGIETVFARQIVADKALAKMYGYVEGTDLQSFAWTLADFFAKVFGYISPSGKEIRVSQPDIAAYQIKIVGNKLTVYEYYNSKIVNIQNITSSFKNAYDYEYYFKK